MHKNIKSALEWLRKSRAIGWIAALYSWLANTEELFPGSVTTGGLGAAVTLVWGLLTGASGAYVFAAAVGVFCAVLCTVKFVRDGRSGMTVECTLVGEAQNIEIVTFTDPRPPKLSVSRPVATQEEMESAHITDRTVRISQVPHGAIVMSQVHGKIFERCTILGPAVLRLESVVRDCTFVCDGEPDATLWLHDSKFKLGAHLVRDCIFRECTFIGIGICGTAQEIGVMKQNMIEQGGWLEAAPIPFQSTSHAAEIPPEAASDASEAGGPDQG